MADEQGSRFRLPGNRTAAPEGAPSDWRATMRSRVGVCVVVCAAWTAAIEARLIYLQVFAHAEMMALANRQHLDTITAPAKRGEILDRAGRVLAYSVDADTIAADPSNVADPDVTARQVCAVLEGCDPEQRKAMAERMRRRGQFVYLARRVSPAEAERAKALQLPGVVFLRESRRDYPKRELAAHVLGYVGLDNVGLAGLESAYDSQIRGKDGKLLIQTDARQHAWYSREERPATAGATLELTVDQYLQYIAERELRGGVEENRAAGGSAVVMDPTTGEILALANWPTFNPNAFLRADEHARRNRAVQDLYEPGSTFKVVTASAAFEERTLSPNDLIDCAPGYITFPGRPPIHDVHSYGTLSFADVIVKSSNVGAIKAGLRIGPERLGRYINRFGFGQTLSPDFRGENPGIVWDPDRLDASALASVSMGYQIGVTTLQMAAAVSSVANGGTLFEPRVVRAMIKDGRRYPVPRKILRRTISMETAATLTEIMEAVVDRGTAGAAQIPGYTIAGKTGTASKLVNGRYSRLDYNASFVGFVPSRNAALTIIVVIDSPHARGYYGGVVAAPVFKRIAEASLRHLGIGPTINPPAPVLVARDDAGDRRIKPRPARAVASGLPAALEPAAPGIMPDLRGLSAREALRILTRIGLSARISGDGFVLQQMPRAGAVLARGESAILKLGRRLPPVAAGGAQQ